MFQDLPRNQHNDHILLPCSYAKFKLPDGTIADPSIVFRESSNSVILSCGYEDTSNPLKRLTKLDAILIPANSVKAVTSRFLCQLGLFKGVLIEATFIFDQSFEAKHMDVDGSTTYRMTDRFSLPIKAGELNTIIERFNSLRNN